jgi:hypothetical protein
MNPKYRLPMTATPIKNRLPDVFRLAHWATGAHHLAHPRFPFGDVDRNLYGAAIFNARAVRSAHLEVVADEPPPRHAAIRGWPWIEGDPELQKAAQKERATLIASQAALVLR